MRKLSGAVEIKGYGNDVNIILSEEADFSDIESELRKKLEDSNRFLSGITIILDMGDRAFSVEECERLKEILNNSFNLTISSVRSYSDKTREAVEKIGWKVESQDEKGRNMSADTQFEEEDVRPQTQRESDTILIKRTIRSGQRESHQGNVVIVGDVNPGAEVEAGGDIIVVGKLRGVAHAGVNGNADAVIIALDLRPIQLRIANYIGRSPDQDSKPDNIPEVARVEGGNIVIRKLR